MPDRRRIVRNNWSPVHSVQRVEFPGRRRFLSGADRWRPGKKEKDGWGRGTVGGRFLPSSILVHRRLLLRKLTDRAVLPVSANHRLFITDRYSLFAGIGLPLISARPIVSRSAPIECPLIVLASRPSVSLCGGV
uniref:Uncharacterized protein n=1 Tax=Plectus sambesii TaxID=2011161 RepID=A0A914UYH4_9BILA